MRPFLDWRDDWLLGLEQLDHQHLDLAALLNLMHGAMIKEQTTSGLDSEVYWYLLKLAKKTREHFQDEEDVMRKCQYPGLCDHHREHVMLMAELMELIRQIEEDGREFTVETLTALKHWQIDHVLNSDREFAAYWQQQGQSAANVDTDFLTTASEAQYI